MTLAGRATPRLRAPGVLLILALHVLLAVVLLERLPRGFPPNHVRFYSNEVGPVLLLTLCAANGAALARGWPAASTLVAVFPGLWLGAAIGASSLFPVTGGEVAWAACGAALVFGALWAPFARRVQARWSTRLVGWGLGVALGGALLWAQRAPRSTTRPQPTSALAEMSEPVALPAGVSVDERAGSVHLERGHFALSISPVLEFQSRSPDGFWTVFSSLVPEELLALDPAEWRLRVEPRNESELHIQAARILRDEVFSHLSSFTTLTLSGHRKLGVVFSPCPDRVIEFVYADYPAGAPARFAYVDEASRFHVVEASSAEKGPFTSLASGRLGRGAPLSLRFVEMLPTEQALLELTFEDWSAQLSTALSPTAGFGVPQNAIEFGLASKHEAAPAHVVLNLAATSIGRGWDSVGHAPGRYENRVTLRMLQPLPPRGAPNSAAEVR